jgi:hypothetical protein
MGEQLDCMCILTVMLKQGFNMLPNEIIVEALLQIAYDKIDKIEDKELVGRLKLLIEILYDPKFGKRELSFFVAAKKPTYIIKELLKNNPDKLFKPTDFFDVLKFLHGRGELRLRGHNVHATAYEMVRILLRQNFIKRIIPEDDPHHPVYQYNQSTIKEQTNV